MHEPHGARAWTRSWPATVEAVGPMRHALVGYADACGAGRYAQDSVGLAVSEAATNAVVHAYRDREQPGDVTISAELLAGGRMVVVVDDDGCGLIPRSDSRGLGLGLAVIAQVVDSLLILGRPGGGTRLEMEFLLTA